MITRLLTLAMRVRAGVRNRATTAWCRGTFAQLGPGSVVSSPARIWTPADIRAGDNLFIGPGSHLSVGAGLTIGDDFMSGPNMVILGGNHDLDAELRPLRIERPENGKHIVIGNNVWIGANVTILAGAQIGDNAVVAAGAVVNGPVAANSIVGGIPAKLIRML